MPAAKLLRLLLRVELPYAAGQLLPCLLLQLAAGAAPACGAAKLLDSLLQHWGQQA
jgi:hypothetical protein